VLTRAQDSRRFAARLRATTAVVSVLAGDENCNPDRLIELVKSGDSAALERITRCYSERLLQAGRRHCRTADEADDAVQDALLSAATNLDEFRGAGSFEGWLVRIVARACRRMSRGRKNDFASHDSDAILVDGAASPESEAARHEVGRLIDGALLELRPEDRTILLLAEVEDFTAAEIAARLGLSPGAVRTRLTRLRERVRTALDPLFDDQKPGG
jgi:RNA polymerase sigma-70 factor, ECF subfamily